MVAAPPPRLRLRPFGSGARPWACLHRSHPTSRRLPPPHPSPTPAVREGLEIVVSVGMAVPNKVVAAHEKPRHKLGDRT